MRIEAYLNTSHQEVAQKKYNIFIGISLGNKYFTPEHIKKYTEWALDHTKDDVLIVVGDKLQAVNFEALSKKSKLSSWRRAYRKGDVKIAEIKNALSGLPDEARKKVKVVRLGDVNRSKYHDYRYEVVQEAFRENKEFHNFVIGIVRELMEGRPHEATEERLEKLADYILKEIPHYLNGFKYKAEGEDWKIYTLTIYPDVGKFDELIIGLQNGTMFPELAQKLKVTDKIAILEGYVD